MLRNPHHITAHDDRQFIVRALVIDIELDIRKIHDVQFHGPGISGYDPGQIHHLQLGALACIRRRMEIRSLDSHASF